MNQPVAGPIGVPGGGPRIAHPGVPANGRPAGPRPSSEGGRTERSSGERNEEPGSTSDNDRLLGDVEDDLNSLDHLDIADQVPVYDRIHTTLAEALARTADTGVPPGPGDPGA